MTILEYTFFSSSQRTFTKIGQILDHKTHFKIKIRIEIMHCMVSDHNGIKLQISKKNIAGKHHNIWKLNYTLLNT